MIGKQYKSLQDSVMEFVVMHFNKMFNDSVLTEANITKKKLLPPCLFERICCKSKEMGLYIQFANALSNPYALNWNNINATTLCLYTGVLYRNRIVYPVKTISLASQYLNKRALRYPRYVASTLENLDVKAHGWQFPTICRKLFQTEFPKLKKLRLNSITFESESKEINLDLSRLSETLEELILHDVRLDESSITSLGTLKKLKLLACQNMADVCQNELFPKALSNLEQLRTLDLTQSFDAYSLQRFQSSPKLSLDYQVKFLEVISKLPLLENFDLSHNTMIMLDFLLEIVKCRKWKKFSVYNACDNRYYNYLSYDQIEPHADQVFGMYDETCYSTLQAYMHDFREDSPILYHYLEFLPIPDDQKQLYENALLLRIINVASTPYHLTTMDYLKRGNPTDNFLKLLILAMCGALESEIGIYVKNKICFKRDFALIAKDARLLRIMLEIIQKDLNKGFTKILLKNFFVLSRRHYSFYSSSEQELGIKDLCIKTLKCDVLYESEELTLAMKKLLVKVVDLF